MQPELPDRRHCLGVNNAHGIAVLLLLTSFVLLVHPAQLSAQPQRVSVLVHLAPGADRGPARAFAANQGGNVKYEYTVLPNVINLRNIPVTALNGLQNVQGVVQIEEDLPVQAVLSESVPRIRADQGTLTGNGFNNVNGSGVRVCVIDTGGDQDHPAFFSGQIDSAAGYDFVNDDADPEDDHWHGTHVSSTAVGSLTNRLGVAPAATLILVKVLSGNGSGWSSDVVAGINWCAGTPVTINGQPQTIPNGRADVISMSLGGGLYTGTCDGVSTASAANNAVDQGVFVAAASGNNGAGNAMISPSCGSNVTAVGATYDTSDAIASFSNRSDELDVTAPGVNITAAYLGGGLATASGTSMATPHVGGLAALILDDNPGLTPAQVRQRIRDGAVDLGSSGFDSTFGYGRIDAVYSLGSSGGPFCGDGICAGALDGEDCTTCPGDCVSGSDGSSCGNAICEPHLLEDCLSCAQDCNGKQNGKPSGRFCCGDGDGQNPEDCGDPICFAGGFDCNIATDPPGGGYCCGDYACEPGEDGSSCAADCAQSCGTDPDCDDTNACTSDACAGGVCSNAPIDCSDGNACTADSCDPLIGCSNTPISCNDGDSCTADSCDVGSGCIHTPIDGCNTCQPKNTSCSQGSECCSGSCKPSGKCR